jgi:hypothetical protein
MSLSMFRKRTVVLKLRPTSYDKPEKTETSVTFPHACVSGTFTYHCFALLGPKENENRSTKNIASFERYIVFRF